MQSEDEVPAKLTIEEYREARAEGHEFEDDDSRDFEQRTTSYDGYGLVCSWCGCYVGPSDGCRCGEDD